LGIKDFDGEAIRKDAIKKSLDRGGTIIAQEVLGAINSLFSCDIIWTKKKKIRDDTQTEM
jgi:hypothetical protein